MPSQCRDGWLLVALLFASISFANGQTPRPAADKTAPPAVTVAHLDAENDWYVAETANFRLYHQHVRSLAEELLRTAERARAAQQRKWFDAVGADWKPKCCICWYPSSQAYSQATGVPERVNGHTDISLDGERVISRRIHLHGSRDVLLPAVLPHEVTHAVLAGRLSDRRVPRWADEGMAILAEARPRIELHLRQLPRCREDRLLFSMQTLVRMRDYPEPRSLGAFHAQSVSLNSSHQ